MWHSPGHFLRTARYVARIVGSSQSMLPAMQWRACLEMPDIFSSDLVEMTSLACWPMRVLKETRVWPMYVDSGSQLHVCLYTPFWSI